MKMKLQTTMLSFSTSRNFSKSFLAACLLMILMAAMLQACAPGPAGTGGTIQGITCQVQQGNPATSISCELTGVGVCDKIQIDFGDGSPPAVVPNYNFSKSLQVAHTYTGWGGKKTVTAGSAQNCIGIAQEIVTVAPTVWNVGFAPDRFSCNAVANKPPLRINTNVHITTNPDPSIRINFGCMFNSCVYDADGKNSTAGAGYPFPNLRPFSLVLRVGTQEVQGGTNVTFTTHHAGPLELCLNDFDLSDNRGAWGIAIEVDESAAR